MSPFKNLKLNSIKCKGVPYLRILRLEESYLVRTLKGEMMGRDSGTSGSGISERRKDEFENKICV